MGSESNPEDFSEVATSLLTEIWSDEGASMRVAFPSDEYSAQVSQPKVAPTMDISEQGHNILYIGSHFDPRYVSSPAASRRSDNQGSQHSSKDGLDRRSQPNTSNGHTTRSTPTASELVKDLDTMLRFGSEPGHDAKVNDFLNALNHAAIEVHKYSSGSFFCRNLHQTLDRLDSFRYLRVGFSLQSDSPETTANQNDTVSATTVIAQLARTQALPPVTSQQSTNNLSTLQGQDGPDNERGTSSSTKHDIDTTSGRNHEPKREFNGPLLACPEQKFQDFHGLTQSCPYKGGKSMSDVVTHLKTTRYHREEVSFISLCRNCWEHVVDKEEWTASHKPGNCRTDLTTKPTQKRGSRIEKQWKSLYGKLHPAGEKLPSPYVGNLAWEWKTRTIPVPRTNTAQSNNFDFNDLNRQSATLDLYNAPTSGEVHPEHVEYRPLVQRNGPDHFVEPEEQMEDQYNTLAYWFNLPEQGDFDVNGLPLALAATKQSAMQTKLPACNKAQAVVTRSPQFTQTSPDVRTEPTLPQSSIPFTGAYPQTLCVSQPTVNHDIPVVAAPVSQEAGFAGTTVLEIIVNELEEFLATHDELAIQEYLDTLPERLRERINTRLDEVRSRNLIAELDTLLDSGPVPKEPERDEVLEM